MINLLMNLLINFLIILGYNILTGPLIARMETQKQDATHLYGH